MHNFRELKVWRMGIEVSKLIFKVTRNFPPEERYGLTSQLNRSAVSIPSNIAEGCGRKSAKEFGHFLSISLGSAFELETQTILAYEFNYININVFEELTIKIKETQKMINALHRTITTNY